MSMVTDEKQFYMLLHKNSLKFYHKFPFSPRKILEPLKKVVMDYLEALYLM